MSKKYYISTSIPYVNAAPHIGHALEFVQADVLARYHREKGDDVFFLTGTDENALKNVQAAEKAGVTTEKWVEEQAEIFKKLVKALSISNDDFIRTSVENRLKMGAEKLWLSCKDGDIYKKQYSGLYCVGCEEFKTAKELVDEHCPDHLNQEIQKISEENYFFKLSNYQKQLEEIIESDQVKIIPETRKNEILSFIKSGLEDFSVSRSIERAKNWGIKVPKDETQIMYVWIDALSNYISALDYAENGEKFQKYWLNVDESNHLIGKNIIRFHAVYWLAFLLSAGIRLPSKILVHGFFNINGQKMSKSIGNVVDPLEVITKYGVDATRYFLLSEIPSGEDGDFSFEKFEARYNGNLANGLGNYTARVLTLAEKVGVLEEIKKESYISNAVEETINSVEDSIISFKLHEALFAIWKLITFGDKYINEHKPWETNDKTVIYNATYILENVAKLLKSFLPDSANKILDAIDNTNGKLVTKKIAPLFPRI